MAIVCDNCNKTKVEKNGEICDECQQSIADSKIDKSYLNSIYLPNELFDKFQQLYNELDETKTETKRVFGKFIKTLGTSFINKITGKEINDPTPKVIIPKEKTLDRIQKILNHNLSAYARDHDLDTPEDLDDWTISDMYSDHWEESLYQYVDNITIMEEEQKPPVKTEQKNESDSQE